MNETYFKAILAVVRKGYWMIDQVAKALKPHGVSEPQYNVLRILEEAKGKPLSVQAIQKAMIQTGSNVTRIVDKLLLKGLVNRSECPTNRRKMDISITKEGLAFLEVLDQEVRAVHQPLMELLSEKELEQLYDLLKKLDKP